MNNNQVENGQESSPATKKDGRANNGRKKGFSLNRPKPDPKSKAKRIPIELLDSVDRLIFVHHKKQSEDGRVHARRAGENQKRFSSRTEIRQIPLDLIEVVDNLVAAFRENRKVSK